MTRHLDRRIITALTSKKASDGPGKRIYLYWTPEAGGWWQWSTSKGWAYRFQPDQDVKLENALKEAPKMGPHFYWPEPKTIEVISVPTIVETKVY